MGERGTQDALPKIAAVRPRCHRYTAHAGIDRISRRAIDGCRRTSPCSRSTDSVAWRPAGFRLAESAARCPGAGTASIDHMATLDHVARGSLLRFALRAARWLGRWREGRGRCPVPASSQTASRGPGLGHRARTRMRRTSRGMDARNGGSRRHAANSLTAAVCRRPRERRRRRAEECETRCPFITGALLPLPIDAAWRHD
jgi:hypothetical protein